ncbi:MAG: TonB-dependent receptor [Bacteroidaceae bacterium]|nr:TonB-dependent receptor [Bacteroidaceae bacterium]
MVNFKNLLGLLVVLLLSAPLGLFAQTRTVTGVVRTATETLIGATVTADGKSNVGVITDIDGRFSMKVPSGTKKLRVSYQGYKTVDVPLTSQSNYEVTLVEDAKMLDEVVAIGYAKVRRRDLTGSTVSVGSEDLQLAPVTTAAQALAGKAAGVNVIQQSGAPGADIQITVRGGTSITQSTSPLYIVDGFQMENGLQNVDINDIETIDVMKDASATAIYGARGSNGVILITTKSGKTGKTEINYNGFVSFNTLGKHLDLLNTEQYVKYQYEFQALRGNTAQWANMFYNGDFNDPSFGATVADYIHNNYANRSTIDWQDQVFGKTGITQNHNVTLSGGNEKTRYMLSYNFVGENGIMDKHGYKKNSIRAKINHELMKGVRFDFASSMQVTAIDGGGSLGGKLKQTILMPATGGILWTDQQMIGSDTGREIGNMMGEANYDSRNPIIDNLSITNTRFTRFITVNAGLEVDIIKNLTFRTAGSYMWQQTRNDYWDNGNTKQAEANASQYGYGYRNNAERSSYQWTNTLNYNFSIVDEHNFGILLGHELYYQDNMKLDNEYRGFSDGNFGLNDVSMGKAFDWNSGNDRNGLVSFFGRLNYNYLNRYLISATLRFDGSSKFAKGNQWGTFPSASAAWRISEEPFMKGLKWLDNLKVRFGIGTSGNNNIASNMYATNYGSGKYGYNGSQFITYVPDATLGNPNLKWEKTTTLNLGLDFSVFTRINLGVDFYSNTSNNLLITNKIPSSTGYTTQIQNLGSVRNSGVEIVLNTINIRSKDFTWTTDFNIAFNRSKVLDIYGEKDEEFFIQDYESRMGFKIEKGAPLGQFYGLVYDGIYTTDDFTQNADGTYLLKKDVPYLKGLDVKTVRVGDAKYKSIVGATDKEGRPVYSVDDRTVIGNAMPKFTGGMTNTFRYKGIDLTVFMNFSYGNDVFNMSTQRFIGPYLANQNTISVMNDRFTLIDPATGKETTNLETLARLNPNQHNGQIWNISANNKYAISDHSSYYIEDGSFLRLSTITLGYSFPKSLISKIRLSKVRIYATLNNICTITGYKGYDPEVSTTGSVLTPGIDNSSYPRAKSWVIGVNLSF